MTKEYTSDSIKVLSDREHIQRRRGMYIGEANDPRALLSEIFDNVCVKYDKGYKTLLKGQKQLVLDIFRAGRCENIRTLIFVRPSSV